MKEMIFKRKSVRKFADEPVKPELLREIEDFAAGMKPLYPDIPVAHRIVTKEQVRFYFPWKAPQLLAIYSENREGYLENVGFLFQQMDLYLQSRGLGSCWMGLGKVRGMDAPDGMEFVILLAFGYPAEEALRTDISQFRRKLADEIADRADPALEPARLAPSSTNRQPWYFTHEADMIHAWCSRGGVLRHKMLGLMNRIDMGIALGQMYVANEDAFQFTRMEVSGQPEGYYYTGSFRI